jgi:phage terminase large subunit
MEFKLTTKQAKLIQALRSKQYRYLLFGGGMGSGKSYLGAFIFISFAIDYPNTRYAVVRKNLTVLKRTTLLTFKKVLNDLNVAYEQNKSENTITILQSNSVIYFIEADTTKDQDLNKMKGLELTAAMIDEANEVDYAVFNILKARIGRENKNNEHAFIFLTCNPDQNWVKTEFYDKWIDNKLEAPYYFLQALPKDNPTLSKSYLEGLEDLPESEYNRYVKGDWSYSDDPNQLIKYEWIKANIDTTIGADMLGVDVAREGNDRTVFTYLNDKGLVSYEVFNNQDLIKTSEILINRLQEKQIGAENVSIDVIGVGGGVVDYMRSKGYFVKAYNSGSTPDKTDSHFQYKNLRAQSYWELREKLIAGTFKLIDDPQLIKELLSIRYFVKDRFIQIESKAEIKKNLGYSPDVVDALVIGMYKRANTFGFAFI